MVYLHKGTLNSNEQEQISGICHKRDYFHRCNVEGKKPGTKIPLSDFIFIQNRKNYFMGIMIRKGLGRAFLYAYPVSDKKQRRHT